MAPFQLPRLPLSQNSLHKSIADTFCENTITLKCSDGKEIRLPKKVAMESPTIRHMIKVDCAHNCIPVNNVNSEMILKVFKYCEKHVTAISADGEATSDTTSATKLIDMELKTWDKEFVDADTGTLYDILMAAYHLQVEGLVHLIIQTVVDKIKGKSSEEIRDILNIKNDFSAEEEEKHRREYEWFFPPSNGQA